MSEAVTNTIKKVPDEFYDSTGEVSIGDIIVDDTAVVQVERLHTFGYTGRLIIDKETFVKCYNKWIIGNENIGYWIDCSNGWMCSKCKKDNPYDTEYCPHCGAKMFVPQESEEI